MGIWDVGNLKDNFSCSLIIVVNVEMVGSFINVVEVIVVNEVDFDLIFGNNNFDEDD